MTLRELITKSKRAYYAGVCECGVRKFDLDCEDGLAYEPVHESAIKELRPELLDKNDKV